MLSEHAFVGMGTWTAPKAAAGAAAAQKEEPLPLSAAEKRTLKQLRAMRKAGQLSASGKQALRRLKAQKIAAAGVSVGAGAGVGAVGPRLLRVTIEGDGFLQHMV